MRLKILVLLFIGSSTIYSKDYTYNQLLKLPKSYAKDFYIYRYLDKNISKEEAKELYKEIKALSFKLRKRFIPYIEELKKENICKKLKPIELINQSSECIKAGLPLYKVPSIDNKLLNKIAATISNTNPILAKEYITVSKKSFSSLIKLPPKSIIDIYNSLNISFIKKYYDKRLPKDIVNALISYNSFNKMVQKIVRSNLLNLQKSIVEINSSSLDADTNFLLGLNAIRFGQLTKALNYFKLSSQKAPFTFERDKALFWQYLLTKDSSILDKLIDSYEINIYSLMAYELKNRYPNNIIYTINPKRETTPYDIKDPFVWINFEKKIESMKFRSQQKKRDYLLKYNSLLSEPYIAKLLYNYKDKKEYFLTPYSWYIKDLPKKREALIYAIARQESRFIPTDVSRSYALGMMQFIPFLAKDIAKKLDIKDFELEDMFDPKTAYKFANFHLNFLEKHLDHPLFIAYAYNGGLGFTKRKILNKGFFKKGMYEPFWSMEMIPNAQARKYGKRVLANYVIYSNLLGEKTSLNLLLEKLK